MKIFVSNFPFGISPDDLYNLFKEYGEVISAEIASDRFTGAAKGHGFIEMTNDGEADAAIQALNGTEWKGRFLKVRESRPEGSFDPNQQEGRQNYRSPDARRGGPGPRHRKSGGGSRKGARGKKRSF